MSWFGAHQLWQPAGNGGWKYTMNKNLMMAIAVLYQGPCYLTHRPERSEGYCWNRLGFFASLRWQRVGLQGRWY